MAEFSKFIERYGSKSPPFNPPLDRDLQTNGGIVRFKDAHEFQVWLENEVRWWQDISSSDIDEKWRSAFESAKNAQIKAILVAGTRISDYTDVNNINSVLNNFATGACLHSSSPLGQEIAKALQDDPDAAAVMLAAHVDQSSLAVRRDQPLNLSALVRAAARIALVNSPIGEAAAFQQQCRRTVEGLERIKADADRRFKDVEVTAEKLEKAAVAADELGGKVRQLSTEFRRATDAHEMKLAALEATLQTRVDIKASERLWRGKREAHRWMAIGAGIIFVVGLAAASIAAFRYGPDYASALGLLAPAGGTTAGASGSDWARLSLLAVPVVAVIWFLRVVARIMFTNLGQLADAAERVAMVDTFLSFEKDGRVKEDRDRVLILQALFRPGPGSAADDAMPPNWFDLIMQRLEKR